MPTKAASCRKITPGETNDGALPRQEATETNAFGRDKIEAMPKVTTISVSHLSTGWRWRPARAYLFACRAPVPRDALLSAATIR
jgi:hypothetical protein